MIVNCKWHIDFVPEVGFLVLEIHSTKFQYIILILVHISLYLLYRQNNSQIVQKAVGLPVYMRCILSICLYK